MQLGFVWKIIDELTALSDFMTFIYEFVTTDFVRLCGLFTWRTIPRRFSKEEKKKTNLQFDFSTADITTEKLWESDFTVWLLFAEVKLEFSTRLRSYSTWKRKKD